MLRLLLLWLVSTAALGGALIDATNVARSTPFDATVTNHAGTNVQDVLDEHQTQKVWQSSTTATTLNGTLTLTASSNSLQFLTGTATGYSVVLPDATALFVGRKFEISNQSSQGVTVKTSGGATLLSLGQTSIGYLALQTNGTAAGVWTSWQVFNNTASGIVNYNVISTTTFTTSSATDVQVTGFTVTPTAGTYAVFLNSNASTTGAGSDNTCTIYNGASAVADSVRTMVGPSGTHAFIMTSQTISQFNGTNAATVYCKTTGTFTLLGRSLLLIRLGS